MIDTHRPLTDDEALSALLDDALEEQTAQRLHERLTNEPSLAARLAELAAADRAVRNAYERIAAEPLPARVLELLDAPAAAPESNVVPFAARRSAVPRVQTAPLAAAAGIALVVGVLLGWLGTPRPMPGAGALAAVGAVAPDSELYAVLDDAPSGSARPLPGAVTATPRLTFRTAAGDYCRQLELRAADGGTEALACRHAGGWRIEVAAFTADASDGLYRPAAGGSAVERTIDAAIDGAPLGAEAEHALIANGWRPAGD